MNNVSCIIYPLGFNCDCATFLRNKGLRTCAFPFDWLTGAKLETRIHLLETRFEGFLLKENLQDISGENGTSSKGTRHYLDTRTGFKFFHDFPADQSLAVSFPDIKRKYDKRINRFYDMADVAKTIYFIWYHPNRPLSVNEASAAKNKLSAIFPRVNVVFQEIKNENDLDLLSLSATKKRTLKNKLVRLAVNIFSGLYFSKQSRRKARRKWEKMFGLE